jgi:hypothetical protein
MTPRLYIAIPVHNRLAIAAQCIPTVRAGMIHGHDTLAVYDDGSTMGDCSDSGFILGAADVVYPSAPVGIERQRRRHFLDFAERMDRMDWTHLYLTDSDALHDPNWRAELLRLQQSCGYAPICGYDTEAHVRIAGNTITDYPSSEVIFRRVAPGISYLLTREHVEKVVRALPSLPEYWSWDWTVPALLGNRFAVTRRSLVEHVGWQGLHHPVEDGIAGGDVARNPTEWLVQKRAEVVAALTPQTISL